MNLTALEYILTIEQCGSISKAASELFVSQPYLSKILKETEETYHITIFTRGPRQLSVTEQGKTFLEMAYNVVQSAKKFDRMFETENAPRTLRISSFPSSYTLGAYIDMVNDMPDEAFRIHFHEEATLKVIQDITTRNAELGAIFLKEQQKETNEAFFRSRRIMCRKLFETKPHIFVREGHPLTRKEKITKEDLYEYGLVAFAPRHETEFTTLDDGYFNSINTRDLLDYDRFSQITYIYDRGTWHSILHQTDFIAIGNQLTQEQLKPFGFVFLPFPFDESIEDPTIYNNTLYCIWLKDRPLSPLANRYMEYLRKYAPEE